MTSQPPRRLDTPPDGIRPAVNSPHFGEPRHLRVGSQDERGERLSEPDPKVLSDSAEELLQRVDDDHISKPPRPAGEIRPVAGSRPNLATSSRSNRGIASRSPGSNESVAENVRPRRQDWLSLHATDLIERIQDWSETVDSREAILNARSAQQDRRERQFRIQQQDLACELSERKRSIERLRRELESQARRMAFLDANS
ncbi:MAG: hypothetical protein ACR2NZ_04240 [Rubripirellula sp.]